MTTDVSSTSYEAHMGYTSGVHRMCSVLSASLTKQRARRMQEQLFWVDSRGLCVFADPYVDISVGLSPRS